MIDCFNIKTCHLFSSDVLASQFRLRYRLNIERQAWEVPSWEDEFEYDSYDNPAAIYFTWRDEDGVVRGCQRLYPTDRPYMLEEAFPFLVTNCEIPKDKDIWEGSRICVDTKLPPELRKRIIKELVIAYLEFAISKNIKSIVGVMLPIYSKLVYINSGWDPIWLGETTRIANGNKVRAGELVVSRETLAKVRRITGIHRTVLNYGDNYINQNYMLETA